MRHLPALVASFAGLALAGCNCCAVAGDSTQPMEVSLAALDPGSGAYLAVPDGGAVGYVTGGQGLLMMAINVIATNVNRCDAKFHASVSDPGTGEEAFSTDVTGSFAVQVDGGWWTMDGTNPRKVIDLLPCYGTSGNFDGTPWQLHVDVTDSTNRAGTASLQIVPTCSQPSCASRFYCHETCSGTPLGADAGPWDGGDCQP